MPSDDNVCFRSQRDANDTRPPSAYCVLMIVRPVQRFAPSDTPKQTGFLAQQP
jgi:hypothetical protein